MKRVFATVLLMGVAILFAAAQVTMTKEENGILILEDGEKVFFYQMDPTSIEGRYERKHYIHPLWGIDGAVLTRDFPADHLHHRGVFWAWHQVWIGDRQIGDPWELIDFDQDIVEVEFRARKDGSGVLNTRVHWLSEEWQKLGHKIPYMEENTIVTVHPEKKKCRRIDFEIRLLGLEKNLFLGGSQDEKGYGGFSVRMVLPGDVRFKGSGGEVEPQVTAVEAPGYVNITGSMGEKGKKGGIVIVDHPGNPGYPQSWILRKKDSMQNAVFPGNALIPVLTSHPLVLKYSLLIYKGKISHSNIRTQIENW